MIKRVPASVLTGFLLLMPQIALAHAGLSELDETGALVLLVAVSLGMAAVPFSVHGTWDFDWYFVYLQIPFILATLTLTVRALKRKQSRTLAYILILPVLYGVLTFATNVAAVAFFRADHSDYFRKEKEIDSYFIRHTDQPVETDILEALGEPFAADTFQISSPDLPKPVTESMKNYNLESAYILSYFERCQGRKGMEQRTYYVILDPTTHRFVTRAAIYDHSAYTGKWPLTNPQ